MKKIIAFFADRHLFTNLFFILVLAGGIVFWNYTNKEELPDIALDFVRISVSYPGASAEEVDYSVTWPVENELKSIAGIETIKSTSSEGNCSITVEIENDAKNRNNIVTEIRNAVTNVNLPDDVMDKPRIKEFKSSQKAIIDIGIYFENEHFLNSKNRKLLQTYAHNLENRLLSSAKINSITKKGYYKEEFRIELNPYKLLEYRIPVSTVSTEISASSTRVPAGTLDNINEDRVTVDGEINDLNSFLMLPIQGTFDGAIVRLYQLAKIKDTYEKNNSIIKINGKEGIILNVRKNSSYGIINVIKDVKKEVNLFKRNISDGQIKIVLLDDESRDVRNRINMIGSNGIIGFALILIVLFIFLNFKSGFWVAMGIPFTFASTMIVASLLGFTINNMTLAAVIIVMGMVVDDAIVVSENIIRLQHKGVPPLQAAIEGAAYVLLPITASILTTIVVFIPLLFFEGRLAIMTSSIPPIVSMMLIASLVESLIILPSHLNLKLPRWVRIVSSLGTILLIEKYRKKHNAKESSDEKREHWFEKVELKYSTYLAKALKFKYFIVLFFIIFLVGAGLLFTKKMKFVLFPREEATSISLIAEAPLGTPLKKTAEMSVTLEKIFMPYLGKEVVGFRTMIGASRRTKGRENQFYMRIEIVNADKRKKSLKQLTREWNKEIKKLKGFAKVRFSKRRFGMSSGSALEIVIQENDNEKRSAIAHELSKELKKIKGLSNIEIGEPYKNIEYRLIPKRDLIKRLNLQAKEAGATMRIALQGKVLYEIIKGDEEKNVRLTFLDQYKKNIHHILSVPVKNNEGYMIPLKNIISVNKTKSPSEITRLNNQRTLIVYADLKGLKGRSPLEIAQYCETLIFPKLTQKYPSVIFSFEGEVKMTRESTHYFPIAVVTAILLIYVILALQFNSLGRPLIIIAAIPPAMASIAYVFTLHGMSVYGFFGIIGAIGLAGVVVNDAIVLLNSLDDRVGEFTTKEKTNKEISIVTASRLRAVILTTITTAAGLFPSAYGIMGYDSMLSEMMLAIAWGLIFGTVITLVMIPAIYSIIKEISSRKIVTQEI